MATALVAQLGAERIPTATMMTTGGAYQLLKVLGADLVRALRFGDLARLIIVLRLLGDVVHRVTVTHHHL